jgi:hypothetical protein
VSKGSKRRKGEGYDAGYANLFGDVPQAITKPTVEVDADWWLECPTCEKVHPRGVAVHPFCDVCDATRLHLHTDEPEPEPEVVKPEKPVTALDRKRARFVEIHGMKDDE